MDGQKMLNLLSKIILTITSIAPVCLTFAIIALFEKEIILALILVLIVGVLAISCFFIINHAKKNIRQAKFEIKSIEAADSENVTMLLLYLLPLLAADVTSINWVACLLVLIIVAIAGGTGYCFHFNPLLGLFKWHFYKVGTTEEVIYVLITRKCLRDAKKCPKVGQLTEYLVLDLETE